jgi:hypothetical protein
VSKIQRSSLNLRWERLAPYGEVPLIRHSSIGRDGKTYERWEYDPRFEPKLPRGAVHGEVDKQGYCACSLRPIATGALVPHAVSGQFEGPLRGT